MSFERRSVRVLVAVVLAATPLLLAATCTSTPTKSGSGEATATATTSESVKKPLNLKVGDTADYPGEAKVTLVAVEAGPKDYSGKPTLKLTVRYENTGKTALSFNTYDWKLEDAGGARTNDFTVIEGSPPDLGSGEIAPGGKKEGAVYLVNESAAVKIVYELSMFSGEEGLATWALQ